MHGEARQPNAVPNRNASLACAVSRDPERKLNGNAGRWPPGEEGNLAYRLNSPNRPLAVLNVTRGLPQYGN